MSYQRTIITYKSLVWVFSLAMLSTTSFVWPSRDAWGANLIYDNSFESQWTPDVQFAGGCYDYSFGLVEAPTREGSQSARVINKGSQDNMPCQNSENHRAQMRFTDRTLIDKLKALNTPIWIGFSVYVPTDHPTNTGGYIVMQLNGGKGGPEFMLVMNADGKTFRVERHWGRSGNSISTQTLANVQARKGQWNDFVIYRERSWNSNGVTRVWLNGNVVADYVGPNAIDYQALGTGGDVRFVTGIYWTTGSRGGAEYTLYFDAVRIAEGQDGFDLVSPNGSGTVTVRSGAGTAGASAPPPPKGLVITTAP